METELRELLRDRADALPPPPDPTPPFLRRARRRRWAGGVLAAVTVTAVVTGGVIGIQAAVGRNRTTPIVQPTPPPTPTPSPSTSGPPPYGDLGQAIWPAANADQFAVLEEHIARGQQTYALRPDQEAVAFAEAILGWSRDDVVVHDTFESGNDARVLLWNQRFGNSFDPSIAETVELQRFGAILGPPNPVWLVSRASTGLLDVTSPSEHQDVLPPNAAVEVAGSLGLPPLGWTLTTILEYADSLLQGSEAQTRNDLSLNGLGFDVTLGPNAAYLSGPTLSLRLVEANGNTLGLYARRFASGPAPSPTPTFSPPATDSGVFAVMLTTIHAASPPHWTFDLTPGRLDGDWTQDGTVDDGSGPGRLMIDVTNTPGMLEAHPCSDPEFTQGAPCVEEQGVGGSLLVLRDVLDQKGNKTIEVVLVRPDRSGIGAEAGNWIISGTPGTSGGGSNEQVTRADPVYTVEQLGNLVQAVAEKVYPCIQAGC